MPTFHDGPAITLQRMQQRVGHDNERHTHTEALPPVVGSLGYQSSPLLGVVLPGPRLFVRVSRPRQSFASTSYLPALAWDVFDGLISPQFRRQMMSSAHYHVHSSAPAGSKVRAEPKVLDSRLGKHAFFLHAQSASRRVSRPGIRLHDGQETTTSGDPRHDRQTTGRCWCWPLIAEERSRVLPAERPSSPGPERSRSPLGLALPWPAEEGHLSPPLLSWQSVSLPTGLGLPRGRARMLPGGPVRYVCLTGWGEVVPPAGGSDDTSAPGTAQLSAKGPDD